LMGRVGLGVQCTLVYYYGGERKRARTCPPSVGSTTPGFERDGGGTRPVSFFFPLLAAM